MLCAMRSLLVFLAVVFAVAGFGSLFPPDAWYAALLKPQWNPPGWVFGLVWSLLYPAIAVAGWHLWRAESSPQRTISGWLWATQLVLNASWTPLFFGAHLPVVALAVVLALLTVIAAAIAWFYRVSRWAAWLFVPYGAWVLVALALNAAIVALN
jgi:tryptophan-rich sensory protein